MEKNLYTLLRQFDIRLVCKLLLSGKNKLKVCNLFVHGLYRHFYSMGACISVTHSKHYQNACFY